MSDIVERLRKMRPRCWPEEGVWVVEGDLNDPVNMTPHEAADEIERLNWLCKEIAYTARSMMNEIERLRSAIAYFEDHPCPDHADMAMQYERGYADGSDEIERLRKALVFAETQLHEVRAQLSPDIISRLTIGLEVVGKALRPEQEERNE